MYSDRVHACIPALVFDKEIMLFGKNIPKIQIFDRIGANQILKEPIELNMVRLGQEKSNQINFLKQILI